MNSIKPGWISQALQTLFDANTIKRLGVPSHAIAPADWATLMRSSTSANASSGAQDITELCHLIHPSAPRVQVVKTMELPTCWLLELSDTLSKVTAIVPGHVVAKYSEQNSCKSFADVVGSVVRLREFHFAHLAKLSQLMTATSLFKRDITFKGDFCIMVLDMEYFAGANSLLFASPRPILGIGQFRPDAVTVAGPSIALVLALTQERAQFHVQDKATKENDIAWLEAIASVLTDAAANAAHAASADADDETVISPSIEISPPTQQESNSQQPNAANSQGEPAKNGSAASADPTAETTMSPSIEMSPPNQQDSNSQRPNAAENHDASANTKRTSGTQNEIATTGVGTFEGQKLYHRVDDSDSDSSDSDGGSDGEKHEKADSASGSGNPVQMSPLRSSGKTAVDSTPKFPLGQLSPPSAMSTKGASRLSQVAPNSSGDVGDASSEAADHALAESQQNQFIRNPFLSGSDSSSQTSISQSPCSAEFSQSGDIVPASQPQATQDGPEFSMVPRQSQFLSQTPTLALGQAKSPSYSSDDSARAVASETLQQRETDESSQSQTRSTETEYEKYLRLYAEYSRRLRAGTLTVMDSDSDGSGEQHIEASGNSIASAIVVDADDESDARPESPLLEPDQRPQQRGKVRQGQRNPSRSRSQRKRKASDSRHESGQTSSKSAMPRMVPQVATDPVIAEATSVSAPHRLILDMTSVLQYWSN